MRIRRALAVIALAAAVAVALATVVLSESSRVHEPAVRTLQLRPLEPPGARTLHDSAHALRVAVPRGWQRYRRRLTPRLVSTEGTILAVTTFAPSRRRERACGASPDTPHVRIGPRDALLHVEEQLDAQPGTRPRRPRSPKLQQQLRRPGLNEPVASVFPWRCLSRSGIVGLHISFRAHGRLVSVTAVAGERTSTRRRRELLGMLQSLRFGPPAHVDVAVRPRSGDPDTRFGLELVSAYRTGRRGRRARDYWAEVRGPGRPACVIQNEAPFSTGPPGARLRAVLDPRRTKGQRWCLGRFRGVVRYRDGLCRPSGECRHMHTRIAGRFRFVVRPHP
jgi:hypothetical protein